MSLPYRIGIQQRVLPVYRLGLFDMLAAECNGGLQIFTGVQKHGEGILESTGLTLARIAWAENSYIRLGGSHLLFQKNMIRWLKVYKPDCLIVEVNPRNRSTQRGARWMHRHGKKVIGWGLGAPMSGSFGWVKKLFWQSAIRNLDGIITYSSSGREQFAALGFDPAKIVIAPNAVAPRPKMPAVKRLNEFKNGQPIILFVGKLSERKRVDVLIHACSRLNAPVKPALWIVGDGSTKQDLEMLANRIYPQAEFLGDLRGPDLEPLWNKADIFVLPGTGGLAVQEAMSHSLPVIVGVADGTQSDLVREENGWQLETGQDDELMDFLWQAFADVKQLRKMGAESYRIVKDEINLEKMVEKFTSAIRTVMESR